MGVILALFCRDRESRYTIDHAEEEQEKKQYSWDKKEKTDISQYIFNAISNGTAEKPPGSVNGQQFIIKDCKNSKLFVFDSTASVSIDDCSDCNILIGPCRGSVFIRDCKNCNLMVACQQFRTRDCVDLTVHLHCSTQPIIEETTSAIFKCLQWNYPGLEGQYKDSGISLFNNLWFKVHDFSPGDGISHFKIMQEVNEEHVEAFTNSETTTKLSFENSIVPKTTGERREGKQMIAIFFTDDLEAAGEKARTVIQKCTTKGIEPIQTKEINFLPSDAERIFGTSKFSDLVKKGSAVAIEAPSNSDFADLACEEMSVLCPTDPEEIAKLSHSFYTFTEMHM